MARVPSIENPARYGSPRTVVVWMFGFLAGLAACHLLQDTSKLSTSLSATTTGLAIPRTIAVLAAEAVEPPQPAAVAPPVGTKQPLIATSTAPSSTNKKATSAAHPPNNSAKDSSTHHSSAENSSAFANPTPSITPQQQAWLDFETEIGRRITYVTARFNTQDGKFAGMVRKFAARLLRQGFPASRLHTYADREFPSFIRNDTRYREHLAFLDDPKHPSRRGGGYWFWKPLLIHHHLAELRDGDILIYCDTDDHTGECFDFDLLHNLARSMVRNETTHPPSGAPEHASGFNLAVKQFQDGGGYCCPEKYWTKGVTYRYFCGPHRNQSIDDTGQFYANFVVVKKTPATVELYYGVAEAATDYYLINDVDRRHPDWFTVKDHRHDQSLLSCSLKCRYHSREHRTFVKHGYQKSALYLLALSPWNNGTHYA